MIVKPKVYEQNRSTEGCSKLKRSVDMTISGKIQVSTLEQMGQDQVSGGVSVLCLMIYLNSPVTHIFSVTHISTRLYKKVKLACAKKTFLVGTLREIKKVFNVLIKVIDKYRMSLKYNSIPEGRRHSTR